MTGSPRSSTPARVHDAAGDWLARRQGNAGPEVERAFRAWLEADPAHRTAYDEAERGWRDSLLLADSAIGRSRGLGRAPFLMRRSTHVGAAGVALAAVLGVTTVGVVQQVGPFALVSPAEAAVYQTGVGEIRTISLADGSRITLDTATRLHVVLTGSDRRIALERGRARFRVTSDRRRPFTVVVPGGEVVARGTLFDVSIAEGVPTVAILEGSVELHSSAPGAPVRSRRLDAGERIALGDRSAPQPISAAQARWVSGMLALDATPLGDAVNAINRYNGTQIRLADQRLARLSVTGAFRSRDPEEFARATAAMFDLTVDRPDPAVILLEPRATAGSPNR
ncbi:FecR domain-containing protein [Sphingobium sp. H39-3-25]|uniref:FecR family protein n=1 Tax=Sphingobium arseniciresistens TaxID=3030834 RepID=UPI0023BA3313|nr:FecR domain-containing protein [Sphingobium arseniciresistens]